MAEVVPIFRSGDSEIPLITDC